MKTVTHYRRSVLIIASLLLLLAVSACKREVAYAVENSFVDLEGATSAQVDIEMRSGDITISGGTESSLLEAELQYNVDKGPPAVDYAVSGSQGNLSIEGTGGGLSFSLGGMDNIWEMSFHNKIPLALKVSISDADADLDLSTLSLTRLDVGGNAAGITANVSGDHPMLAAVVIDSNAGRAHLDLTGNYDTLSRIESDTNGSTIKLDLTGSWAQNLDVTLGGGTRNDVTLVLPQDIGVSVTVESDTNEVSADGFSANGRTYTNSTFGTTPVTIAITVRFKNGKIHLVH